MKQRKVDFNILWLVIIGLAALSLIHSLGWAKEARVIRLSERQVGKIMIHPGQSTILSFSMKPTKVILGNRGVFALEYVENDLAIAALAPNVHSNLFVYLPSGRFAFDLVTTPNLGDEIVVVQDAPDKHIPVK